MNFIVKRPKLAPTMITVATILILFFGGITGSISIDDGIFGIILKYFPALVTSIFTNFIITIFRRIRWKRKKILRR